MRGTLLRLLAQDGAMPGRMSIPIALPSQVVFNAFLHQNWSLSRQVDDGALR